MTIQERFKAFTLQHGSNADKIDIFTAGYRAGVESVGDLVLSEDKTEEVAKLKKEISNLKGQITKLNKTNAEVFGLGGKK